MAHSRVSRVFSVAVTQRSNRYELGLIYAGYKHFCYLAGVKPAEYEQWKMIRDDSYKLAGVTRK